MLVIRYKLIIHEGEPYYYVYETTELEYIRISHNDNKIHITAKYLYDVIDEL